MKLIGGHHGIDHAVRQSLARADHFAEERHLLGLAHPDRARQRPRQPPIEREAALGENRAETSAVAGDDEIAGHGQPEGDADADTVYHLPASAWEAGAND